MLKEKLKEEKEKEEQTLNKQNNSNEDNNSNNIDTIFNKTIKNTSSVLFFSMISKIINILCNIILVRHISKEAYGTANIHLELLFSLICTFPIDKIRKTSQKFCPGRRMRCKWITSLYNRLRKRKEVFKKFVYLLMEAWIRWSKKHAPYRIF